MRRLVLWVRLLPGVLAAVPVTLLAWPLSAPAAAADWAWPLAGPPAVSRPFDPPATRYGAGHRGADLTWPSGAAVRAAGAGRVSYAGLLAGRGVVVVVHGELRTTYEPVTASVAVGDVVGPGAVLGRLEPGHAGCPVAACLHWGLRRGEDYLDPVRLVRAGPVRLLPLGAGAPTVAAGEPDGAALAGGPGPAGGPALAGGTVAASAQAPARVGPEAGTRPPVTRPTGRLGAVPVSSSSDEAPGRVPLGALAVAALVAGIGLLARPRPDPLPPTSPSPAVSTSPDAPAGEPPSSGAAPTDRTGALLDLDEARARRRAAS